MWYLILFVASAQGGKYENVNLKLTWWERALIYDIYPRSFMDSDNDGVGDLNGITTRLEYLKELGVDAVLLEPIFKSSNQDYGFDISDYYSIQPEYGSMEDFEHLVKKAGDHGIKIILEFVPNHMGNESEWFVKSANKDEYYSDWFIWENGHIDSLGSRKPPNNWLSVFRKSAWTYSPSREQYYLHHFGSSQPDLNYRNPVVVEEIKTIIKFWLEKGVAGMRMSSMNYIFEADKDLFGGRYPNEPLTGKPDVTSQDYEYLEHIYTKDLDETYELLSQFREVFDSISVRDTLPRIMMTEAHTNIKNTIKYYGGVGHLGAHIPMNFLLMDEIDKESDARDLKYTIDKWLTYKPMSKAANWVTGSHDKSRIASRFRPELVDAFNMLVLLLPGIAVTFMGEEIGMANGNVAWTETKDPIACNTDDPVKYSEVSRDPIRTPFQWSNEKNAGFSLAAKTWLPLADGSEHLNVAQQRSAVRSHYQVYRTLAALRMRPAFRVGRYESMTFNNEVFAFKRWYNDDTYVVAMNIGKKYHVVNLTAFDLVFGTLEVEASSVLSSRALGDTVQAGYLDLAADEALALRMQV